MLAGGSLRNGQKCNYKEVFHGKATRDCGFKGFHRSFSSSYAECPSFSRRCSELCLISLLDPIAADADGARISLRLADAMATETHT